MTPIRKFAAAFNDGSIIAASPVRENEEGTVPRRIVLREFPKSYIVHVQQFEDRGCDVIRSSYSAGMYFDKACAPSNPVDQTQTMLYRAWLHFQSCSNRLMGWDQPSPPVKVEYKLADSERYGYFPGGADYATRNMNRLMQVKPVNAKGEPIGEAICVAWNPTDADIIANALSIAEIEGEDGGMPTGEPDDHYDDDADAPCGHDIEEHDKF